jgi:predicted Holliday junction resolvase-like endonuclease
MDSSALLVLAVLVAAVFAVLYFLAIANIEQHKNLARKDALAQLQIWKNENEAFIRQDAIDRSHSVIAGKVAEQITPWLPTFPYNPKDARFIGSPIDMIIFDGADEGDLQRIIFLEIKTGSAALNGRQRQIRNVIKSGKVEWQELKIQKPDGALPRPAERPLLA